MANYADNYNRAETFPLRSKKMEKQKIDRFDKLTAKIPLRCLECNKTFKRTLTKNIYPVKCPKCHGYDIEVDYDKM